MAPTVRAPGGGRKTTAGRRKGSKNKKTLEHQAMLEKARSEGLMPLEYMLKLMRDEKESKEVRMEMAKHAAGYLHPRLTTTKVSGDPSAPLFDLSGLTDAELAFLRRTVLKATKLEEGD
jgi:hypothetical protein